MTTIDNLMALHDEAAIAYSKAVYVVAHVSDKQGDEMCKVADETKEALRTALTELVSTATEYQQAADKMAMDHKVERDTLRQQLTEALALIETSRNQEAVAWKYTHVQSGYTDISLDHPEKMNEWNDMQLWHTKPLFSAPVIAPDVLSALKMAVLQNSHDMLMTGEEIRKCESAIQAAMGGAV